jgi:hypothetical protein
VCFFFLKLCSDGITFGACSSNLIPRKISTLKPDAPEFVPHSKDENLKPSTKSDSKTAAKTQKTLERERKVSIKVYRKGKGKGGADGIAACFPSVF